jgi:hypothetical protein
MNCINSTHLKRCLKHEYNHMKNAYFRSLNLLYIKFYICAEIDFIVFIVLLTFNIDKYIDLNLFEWNLIHNRFDKMRVIRGMNEKIMNS